MLPKTKIFMSPLGSSSPGTNERRSTKRVAKSSYPMNTGTIGLIRASFWAPRELFVWGA